ncbi:MAG: hypothetical protein RR348_02100 [Clostridia bacterium]
MKISTMVAFSAGAVAAAMVVKSMEKPKANQMMSMNNFKDKLMKVFE